MTAYIDEVRRHPRFKVQVDIEIYSRTSGVLKGYSVDISESGIAAKSGKDPFGAALDSTVAGIRLGVRRLLFGDFRK